MTLRTPRGTLAGIPVASAGFSRRPVWILRRSDASADPPAHIRRVTDQYRHAVVVVGAHERTRLERLVLGSVSQRVVAGTSVPVLLVPPHDAQSPDATVTCKHILCAVDLLPSSLEGLRYALSLAREADATLEILHVVEGLTGVQTTEHFRVPEYLQHRADAAGETLRQHIPDEAREACRIRERVVIGSPVEAILEASERSQPGVVVMGTGDRAHLRLLWLAPTVGEVARRVTCPILVVPLPPVVGRELALAGRQVEPAHWAGLFDEISLRHLGHPATMTVLSPGAAEPEVRDLPFIGMTLEGPPRRAAVVMLGSRDGAHLTHTVARLVEVHLEERKTHGVTRLLLRSDDGSSTLIEVTRPRREPA